MTAFSNSKTVSISGVMDSAKGELATAGSKITLGGVDWIIESVQRTESNTGFVNLQISARTADSAIITPISGSTPASSSSGN